MASKNFKKISKNENGFKNEQRVIGLNVIKFYNNYDT